MMEIRTHPLDVLRIEGLFVHVRHFSDEFHGRVSPQEPPQPRPWLTVLFFGVLDISSLSLEIMVGVFYEHVVFGFRLDTMMVVLATSRFSDLDDFPVLDWLREGVSAFDSCLMGHIAGE